jgi:hypothetical protein
MTDVCLCSFTYVFNDNEMHNCYQHQKNTAQWYYQSEK